LLPQSWAATGAVNIAIERNVTTGDTNNRVFIANNLHQTSENVRHSPTRCDSCEQSACRNDKMREIDTLIAKRLRQIRRAERPGNQLARYRFIGFPPTFEAFKRYWSNPDTIPRLSFLEHDLPIDAR
jgi:hypothetical protein